MEAGLSRVLVTAGTRGGLETSLTMAATLVGCLLSTKGTPVHCT